MSSTSMCSVLLLAPVALWAAATAPEPDLNKTFKRMEVQIPMRDGVKLYTDIYIPKKSRGQLPFLFTRTPYGSTDDKGRNGALPHSYKDFVDDGYIFVFQDIRGRFKSEGQFVMFRPAARPKATRRPSTRAPTPTTRSTGCSRTSRTTTAGSACSASPTAAG